MCGVSQLYVWCMPVICVVYASYTCGVCQLRVVYASYMCGVCQLCVVYASYVWCMPVIRVV